MKKLLVILWLIPQLIAFSDYSSYPGNVTGGGGGGGAGITSPPVNVKDYGAIGDGSSHTITTSDITSNTGKWIGTYVVGDEWDYVGIQEAIYAAFARPTPGTVTWNAVNQTYIHNNRELFIPHGRYRINKQLALTAQGFHVRGEARETTFLWYYGPSNRALLYCDAASYGVFERFTLTAQVATSQALMELDWTGTFNTLKTQQVTVRDIDVQCNQLAAYGIRVSKTGSGSQGDTILVANCFFSGATTTALYFVGFNALGNTVLNGDFQNNYHQSIKVEAGQLFVLGTHFENQNLSQPWNNQVYNDGGDIWVSAANQTCQFVDMRSESEISLKDGGGNTIVQNLNLIGAGISPWAANVGASLGQLIHPVTGDSGRVIAIVDSSPPATPWRNVEGSSTLTVINDSGAGLTPGAWVGRGCFVRYCNGFVAGVTIASNTATSITLTSALPFDYHCAPSDTTCFCSGPFTNVQYQLAGISGSTEPTWSSLAKGYRLSGVSISSGANTLTATVGWPFGFTSGMVGNYVIIPGAGSDPTIPLVTTISGFTDTTHVTLTANAGATVSGGTGFTGASITDGSQKLMDIETYAAQNAKSLRSSVVQLGRVKKIPVIEDCAFSRSDWLYIYDYMGGSSTDNPIRIFASRIINCTPGGDIFGTGSPSSTTGTQSFYNNFLEGYLRFDYGLDGTVAMGPVAFGRGDASRGDAATSTKISRNVAAFVGTLGKPTKSGTNIAGDDAVIQGGLGTGTGGGGRIAFRTQAAGSSGTTVGDSTERASIDTAGRLTLGKSMRLTPQAFASAVPSPAEGDMMLFTDSSTNSHGAIISAGGSFHVVGYYNSANWVVLFP